MAKISAVTQHSFSCFPTYAWAPNLGILNSFTHFYQSDIDAIADFLTLCSRLVTLCDTVIYF